jgi:5-methyltetrahydrofolate--homocysteine methyltransferase
MSVLDQIADKIIVGDYKAIPGLVQQALDQGMKPQEIIDKGLIAGMDVVGARFKADEMFIPEVLLSAKTMHAGMAMLQPFLVEGGSGQRECVILGTVKGDVHDIGKNLVGMMFTGVGFKVVDIGTDQPAEAFLNAAKENGARAVAMSALLTTTMNEMKVVINALSNAGLRDSLKVLVGGAPVSESFAQSIGADGYAPDAGSAVEKLRVLLHSA